MNQNDQNSNWKFFGGFRNMQEKLEKEIKVINLKKYP